MKAEIKKAAGGNIRKAIQQQMARIRRAMINNLLYVGEAALKQARDWHKYKNQTGNLASSIGYCILDNGKPLYKSTFEQISDGADGTKKGEEFLEQVIAENPTGLVFIMVAGMPYAKYVEAMNLDVLDSAEILAKRMIPKIMRAIGIGII
ncbi:hypothetical protein EVA_06625 [gut metagenome]|uniref:Uncharacterized protein n=1 Tax=gut metagenome TaxID=749906 RepID=J9GEE0_9ZZZZ